MLLSIHDSWKEPSNALPAIKLSPLGTCPVRGGAKVGLCLCKAVKPSPRESQSTAGGPRAAPSSQQWRAGRGKGAVKTWDEVRWVLGERAWLLTVPFTSGMWWGSEAKRPFSACCTVGLSTHWQKRTFFTCYSYIKLFIFDSENVLCYRLNPDCVPSLNKLLDQKRSLGSLSWSPQLRPVLTTPI